MSFAAESHTEKRCNSDVLVDTKYDGSEQNEEMHRCTEMHRLVLVIGNPS